MKSCALSTKKELRLRRIGPLFQEILKTWLDDARNKTATQIEINKKRKSELAKLKSELEVSNLAHEGTLSAFETKA